MFDTLYIGTSGLIGYSKGLRVVSNNLSNVNTPGYKGAQLQFANFFYQGGSSHGTRNGGGSNYGASFGTGLTTLETDINFRGGTVQSTGNPLDLVIEGAGFFVVRDEKNPQQMYTRYATLALNADNKLVTRNGGLFVQGYDKAGNLGDISLADLTFSAPKATTTVTVSGNLKSDATEPITTEAFKIVDSNGTEHSLKLKLTKGNVPVADTWTVTLLDGTTEGSSGVLQFANGAVTSNTAKFTLPYTPAGGAQMLLQFDFSGKVTYLASSQGLTTKGDGHIAGALDLQNIKVDEEGKLNLTYSNDQKQSGPAIALAQPMQDSDMVQLGGGLFAMKEGKSPVISYAKTLGAGSFKSNSIEGSNVDLAQEFSNLIVMQRGYQASSRVVSTVNEMIQELFDMKGRN